METTPNPQRAGHLAMLLSICLLSFATPLFSQPTVTVRLANPTYDCTSGNYCLDVEFLSDQQDAQVFGMNVRFFYDDDIMELVGFSDFQGGYGPVSPDPPQVTTNGPAGPALFNFGGPAEFINGAIQLLDSTGAINLDTVIWTKLFQICFQIDDPGMDPGNFCPPVVWDLEQDPSLGGFLVGDDGVVITIVDPDPFVESASSTENVVQYNWMYTGPGTPPFGTPIATSCINVDCSPHLVCAADLFFECATSADTAITGSATATDICDGDIVITFNDSIVSGTCPNKYTLLRTWIATNDCLLADTCIQTITVMDTIPPSITCVAQASPVDCPALPVFTPPTATDACDATVTITFVDASTPGSCTGTYSTTRTWTATDDCGNTATCSGTIVVRDITPPTITCVVQTTPVNCPALPVFTPPTATDACDATVTITFVDASTPGTCTGTYSTTRTWTATDDCGNTTTCSGTIVVRDITPPTITCVAQTTPVNCPALPVFTPPTATDACDATVTITFVDATTPGTCTGTYSTTRTWTATDDCGNIATCSGTIVVRDITPPTITCVAQTTPVNCPALPVFTPPTATDACDATVTITFVDATTPGTCTGTYSTTRTWTATDDCGNTATCSGTIVVRDNTPPTITCVAQTTPVNCPALPVFTPPTATDACDATVTITFVDATTPGTCTGTYSTTRTWTATDDCGNTATCTGTIVVRDITSPTITCVAQTTPVNCPALPVFTPPTATDACDATVTITFVDATTPGTCTGTYSTTRTWTATDDCGNTATCSGTIVVRDITPPTITCVAQTTPVNCPALPVFTPPTATDACDATVTITFVDATTPGTCTGTYSTTRTWTATDDCGNTATCSGTIVVRDNTPPTITCVAQTTPVNCPALPVFTTPTATDACDATVTITFVDASTPGTCTGTYSTTRTWTATDDCGNTATCTGTIVVRDITPPTITCVAQTTPVNCPALPVFTPPTATDACDATVTITFIDATTPGTCTGTYSTTRTWTATDDCGNTATCSGTIVVRDITPPTITCVAQTTPVNCPALPVFTPPTATDACDATVTITFVDASTPGTCTGAYSTTRTWTATDDCGNIATCSGTIVVRDITPPTITCVAQTTPVNCPALPVFTPPTATDACDATVTITFVDASTPGTCTGAYSTTRTWTATDDCGNIATCSGTIVVRDITPPTITCVAQTTPVNCPALPVFTPPTATDACDATVTITFVDTTTPGTCTGNYSTTRTWTATDDCGNTATCSGTIVVRDITPPTITCVAQTTPVNCPALPVFTPPTATDACDATVTITFVDASTPGTCTGTYSTTRTWTATDDCGNTATCTGTIVVRDITPPTITCAAQTTPVNCPALPVFTPPTATDACDATVTMTFVDATSPGTCTGTYSTTRTWTATDDCGNTATCSGTIVVRDLTPPTITCVAQTTPVNCPALPVFTPPTATDACDATVTITFVDASTPGTCTGTYSTTRTWTATDDCGNTATCSGTIVVRDITPPTITCVAQTTPVNCPALPVFAPPTATDACDATVTITFVDASTPGTCTGTYSTTRTWTATDECGNTATCAQVIMVLDNGVPTITCPPDITLAAEDSTAPMATGFATGTDNCTGVPAITYDDVTLEGLCRDSYVIHRTWTATDACGNISTCPQVIQIDADCLFDLALIKDLNAGQDPINPGDDIDFTITVTNEGDFAVSSLTLTDYIPIGFSLNDVDWLAGTNGSTGQSASIILSIGNGLLPPSGLLPAASVSVEITLHIDVNIPSDVYENIAEISLVFDLAGNDVSGQDIDSDPDTVDTNDPPAEDDHDIALICLIRPPVIVGERFVCAGETTTYTVGNYNPSHQYIFELVSGGTIVGSTPSSISILWDDQPGASFELTLTEIALPGCEATTSIIVTIEGEGPVACIDKTNISIDNECGTKVLSGMILTGDLTGDNSFQVYIIDMNGDTIPDGILTWEHVGKTFKVSVVSACTGQSCWGYITVEDKLPPIINCVCPVNGASEGCTINCMQADQFLNGDIPEEFRPIVVDNCGGTTLDLINVDLSFPTCTDGYVRLTWKATDTGGNTSTCVQQYDIIPIELRLVEFPADYVGGCFESGEPEITGWPQIDGLDLTDNGPICNLYVSYWDREIGLCGEGRKIIRTWTIMDWCAGRTISAIQSIFLQDKVGPVLTCNANMQVGTSVWFCYANVIVPKPQVTDECSAIQGYTLTSSAGSVVVNGNSYIIQNLPIGIHTARWKVTDECGNSSTCTFQITVTDNVPPVVSCHLHTVVSLTNERSNGITLVPANVFSDGSFDNCSNVTYRARRMDSCIDFDWTTGGACVDDTPGGIPAFSDLDRGVLYGTCVPFACCDVGQPGVMVQLEVSDAAGNVNYCMVEVEVQDKLAPELICAEDIFISCEYPLSVEGGVYSDVAGNNDGSVDEDPLSAIFGNLCDAFRHTQAERKHIIINDPDNPNYPQPHDWGLEGWAMDNCELDLSVRVNVIEDCSGASFPGDHPAGAVKLIERSFLATDGVKTGSCLQRIWVIDYDRFYIADTTCSNQDPLDGVIWPCDVLISSCPADLGDTGEPIILDDGCSLIGMTYEDERYDFAEGACYKILRTWKILDWCQFNATTGYGLWSYVQTIKVADSNGAVFIDAPSAPVEYCLSDPGISLPENNQVFLGENNPESSSCSVHVDLGLHVQETCSESVIYDVKIYLFNGPDFIQIVPETVVSLDANHEAEIRFNTQECNIPSIQENGLPYTSNLCNDYHRVLWTVEDGCGNRSYADYLFRLEDCKNPIPVCIEGISTVIMPIEGEVTLNASSFNASSFDDCTPGDELLFSFSGTSYQPTFTYTCDNVPAFGVEIPVDIWAADAGVDQNCNGVIEWSERNKEFCTTTIIITDNNNVCDNEGGLLEGEVITEQTQAVSNVIVRLNGPDKTYPVYITAQNGKFAFTDIPPGPGYTITPQRNDDHRNGVSTLDLVRIQKHLLGLEVFSSPYQYIAADANNSKSVSAIDLIEIRKLILGLQNEFSNNQSWRFVQKGIEMAPGNPWPFNEQIDFDFMNPESGSAKDFIGVKIGDVNNSVQANAGQVKPRTVGRSMHVKASGKGNLELGEEVEVVFEFPEKVSGFQWTMETTGLEFVDVNSEDILINRQNVGILGENRVTMSWNGDVKEMDSDGMSIKIKFKVTQAGRLINAIDLTSAVTHAEAYTLNGEVQDVGLTFSSTGIFTDFALYQNKPNPWNSQTLIGFHLPIDAHATLTVYDVNGKVIKTISGSYKAGYNSITLSADEMPGAGVLYYRLESGQYIASKKMVLVH